MQYGKPKNKEEQYKELKKKKRVDNRPRPNLMSHDVKIRELYNLVDDQRKLINELSRRLQHTESQVRQQRRSITQVEGYVQRNTSDGK